MIASIVAQQGAPTRYEPEKMASRTAHRTARPKADEAAAPAAGETIGPHIRAARQAAKMTLAQVAQESGLSVGYLSEVERSRLTPSLSALKRIADVLKIPASKVMFEFGGKAFANSDIGVVRRGVRKRISFPHSSIEYELLTPDLKRRASLLWMTAPPRTESGPSFSHSGEDGVIVLRGVLKIEIGNVWYTLHEGDSIYFNSEIAHRWSNEGPEPVEAIWLSTPPSF
jgi:transcriptional regulator with XRE-family HTH domain